ncbi:MAG: ATP-binding protein [Cytophagaceae bacterium]|jgi:hypothetical protein|nr:ATP-binding protein [Cytophagaceae bacterium]
MLTNVLIEFEKHVHQVLSSRFPEIENNLLEQSIQQSRALSLVDLPDGDTTLLDQLNEHERLIALLALCRYVSPVLLNRFFTVTCIYPNSGLIGGRIDKEARLFYPTVFTALFLIANGDTSRHYLDADYYFNKSSALFQLGILKPLENEALFKDSELECSPEFIYRIALGKQFYYSFSSEFPASPIVPKEDWSDLILPYSVQSKVEELKMSILLHQQITEHPTMGKRFRKNVIALFSGEPGTGKTLTAGLLGKSLGMPVYRIDLSRIVSKWVGETTKNLRNLLDVAESKNWLLFFDEADSIFGKRSKGTGEANDHYHNQEIAYLLQRMEEYNGFVIMATNLGINIDDAFRRRIETEITFMPPDKDTRIRLWEKAFHDSGLTFRVRGPKKLGRLDLAAGDWSSPDEGISLEEIAHYWDRVTGAKINKVMKRLLIESLKQNTSHLPSGVIVQALVTELGPRKL